MYINPLVVRGPITALGILVTVSVFSAGSFFLAIRNTALDCAKGSATGAACAVDILTDVVTALVATGAATGAVFVGLSSPTPRTPLVFQVDGQQIDWYEGMQNHKFGLNRTIDNPAVVEWQLNHTSPVRTYKSYEQDGSLVMLHDLGLQIPDPSGKRSDCQAYYHTIIYGDDLRSYEFASTPTPQDYTAAAAVLFNYMADKNQDATCVSMRGTDNYSANFQFGASCAGAHLPVLNCVSGGPYNDNLLELQF